MREIDSNRINNLNFTNIQKADKSGEPVPEPTDAQPAKEVKDLGSMPQLGKSQIPNDTIQSDMAFMGKHAKQVEQMNAIFDKLLENHSYEEATQLLGAYQKEFV